MPSDMAMEKKQLLTVLCSHCVVVPPVSFSNPSHFCNAAKSAAAAQPSGSFYADQFDNPSNWRAHFLTTGPELVKQLNRRIDAVIVACGTGGLAAGVSQCLRVELPNCRVILVDPAGSSLYSRVKHGVAFAPDSEREGRVKTNQVDTIIEGIRRVLSISLPFSPQHFCRNWRSRKIDRQL